MTQNMWEPYVWVSNQYSQRPNLDGSPQNLPLLTREDALRAARTKEPIGFGVPVPGTPDQIIEHFLPIVRGEDELITNVLIEVRQPGVSTEAARRTLKLFAEEVLPVLKKEAEPLEH